MVYGRNRTRKERHTFIFISPRKYSWFKEIYRNHRSTFSLDDVIGEEHVPIRFVLVPFFSFSLSLTFLSILFRAQTMPFGIEVSERCG